MLAANHVDHFFSLGNFQAIITIMIMSEILSKYTHLCRTCLLISQTDLPNTCEHNSCAIHTHTYTTAQQIIIQLNVSVLLYQRKCKFPRIQKVIPVSCVRVNATHVLECKPLKWKRTKFILENRSRIRIWWPFGKYNICLERIMEYNLCARFSKLLVYFIIWINKKAKTQMIYTAFVEAAR